VEFLLELLGTWNPAGVLSRLVLAGDLMRYRVASRPLEEATELGQ